MTVPRGPSNFTAAAIEPGSVQLTWADNSTNERGFEFQVFDAADADVTPGKGLTAAANATSKGMSGLPGGAEYNFRVRARDSAGASDWSNRAYVVTSTTEKQKVPTPPSDLTAVAFINNDPQYNFTIRLNWSDRSNDETNFVAEHSTDGINWDRSGYHFDANNNYRTARIQFFANGQCTLYDNGTAIQTTNYTLASYPGNFIVPFNALGSSGSLDERGGYFFMQNGPASWRTIQYTYTGP